MSNEIILVVDNAEESAMLLTPSHPEWKIYDPLTQNKDTDVHEVDIHAWAWRGDASNLELGKCNLMATVCYSICQYLYLVGGQPKDPAHYTMDDLHYLRRNAYRQLWENDMR